MKRNLFIYAFVLFLIVITAGCKEEEYPYKDEPLGYAPLHWVYNNYAPSRIFIDDKSLGVGSLMIDADRAGGAALFKSTCSPHLVRIDVGPKTIDGFFLDPDETLDYKYEWLELKIEGKKISVTLLPIKEEEFTKGIEVMVKTCEGTGFLFFTRE